MKSKLYSFAHMESAKIIFPDRFGNSKWLETKWTDDEINACKAYEFADFMKSPSIDNYPGRSQINDPQKDLFIVMSILRNNPKIKSFLSIGCGPADKELRLALEFPDVEFIALDNAPYTQSLNILAKDMGISNIKFINEDLRNLKQNKFDLIYSFAVIYCIPDEEIKKFIESIMDSLNKGGIALVGCSGNYSLKIKLGKLLKVLYHNSSFDKKLIGWVRDVAHIKRYIPAQVKIEKIFLFPYVKYGTKNNTLTHFFSLAVSFFSQQNYLFVLKKSD